MLRPSVPSRIALDVDAAEETRLVEAEPAQLRQLLMNLALNSVQAIDGEGRVTVRAYDKPQAQAVVLEVVDTGIGIAREERERIFEPFRQGESSDEKRYGGVGLGLALVARLTDLLGARVELDSEVGKGSTFRVIVPLDYRGRAVSRLMRAVTAPEGVTQIEG